MADEALYGWKWIGGAAAAGIAGFIGYFTKKAKQSGNCEDFSKIARLEAELRDVHQRDELFDRKLAEAIAHIRMIEKKLDYLSLSDSEIRSLFLNLEDELKMMMESVKRTIQRVRQSPLPDSPAQ